MTAGLGGVELVHYDALEALNSCYDGKLLEKPRVVGVMAASTTPLCLIRRKHSCLLGQSGMMRRLISPD